jgi:hypothetical protein
VAGVETLACNLVCKWPNLTLLLLVCRVYLVVVLKLWLRMGQCCTVRKV